MPFCFFLSPFSLSLSSDSHCWIVSERKPNTGREWSLCGISTARGSVLRTLLALSVSPPLVVGGGRWDELPAQVLLWASVGGFTGRHPQGGKHPSRMRGSDKVGGLLLSWLHYFHWWESLLAVLPRSFLPLLPRHIPTLPHSSLSHPDALLGSSLHLFYASQEGWRFLVIGGVSSWLRSDWFNSISLSG